MGGGGSETIVNAQVIGLSKQFGALKKKILLENGKYISSGMNVVIKARGQSIVDIKSLYNKKYLEAMGYAPDDNKYQKLFEAQMNAWALMYSSGLLSDKPSIISNDSASSLYNTLKPK